MFIGLQPIKTCAEWDSSTVYEYHPLIQMLVYNYKWSYKIVMDYYYNTSIILIMKKAGGLAWNLPCNSSNLNRLKSNKDIAWADLMKINQYSIKWCNWQSTIHKKQTWSILTDIFGLETNKYIHKILNNIIFSITGVVRYFW